MEKIKLNIQKYASGTISQTSSTSSKASTKVEWTSSVISGQNASTVTATTYIKRASSGNTSCTFNGSISIDGQSDSISQYRTDWTTSWKAVGSVTKTVQHNADGTKSLTISSSVATADSSTSLSGTYKASGTITLDTINRASVLSEIDDFKLTDTITVGITKYISGATDKLVISAGSTTIKTINSISNGASISFTTTEQNTIKSLMVSPQIELTFTLTTTSSGSTIGTSTQTATVTSLSMPLYRNIVKKANDHYQVAINGVVDENYDEPLQIYDDDGNILNATTTGTPTFTKSSGNGNITSASYVKSGRVVDLVIIFNTSGGSTSAGSNIWQGTLNTNSLLPMASEVKGVGYYGSTHFIGNLNSSGELTIRALGGTVASNSSDHGLHIHYISV